MNYSLVTAAKNESKFIDNLLKSVVAQTHPPIQWTIVDDGSTDGTAEIVERYSYEYPWIRLIRLQKRVDRNFAGKAYAVNLGIEAMDGNFEIIGNIDADVSFEPDYMAFVTSKFDEDSKLGIAGTPFTEVGGYDSTRDSFEGQNYVAGPCQLFRYACWQDIGGYVANKAGGVDWIAVMTARMRGWNVRAFADKRFHHHRSMGTAQRSQLASMFSYGEKDYYLGGSPIWELIRCAYRLAKRPYFFGGFALFLGYFSAAIRRMPRAVSAELMQFHRADQMNKLKGILDSLLKAKRASSFSLSVNQHSSKNPSDHGR